MNTKSEPDIETRASAIAKNMPALRAKLARLANDSGLVVDEHEAWWQLLCYMGPADASKAGFATLAPNNVGSKDATPTELGSAVARALVAR